MTPVSSRATPPLGLIVGLLRRRRDAGGIVGIDGGTGVGKTTLADQLRQAIPAAAIVGVDEFIRPRTERRQGGRVSSEVGWDVDWRRLRADVLEPGRRGAAIRYLPYDWVSDEVGAPRTILAGAPVIVEGVYSLRAELRDCYDVTVWMLGELAARHEAAVARDGAWSRASLMRWWAPDEDRYLRQSEDAIAQSDFIVHW